MTRAGSKDATRDFFPAPLKFSHYCGSQWGGGYSWKAAFGCETSSPNLMLCLCKTAIVKADLQQDVKIDAQSARLFY